MRPWLWEWVLQGKQHWPRYTETSQLEEKCRWHEEDSCKKTMRWVKVGYNVGWSIGVRSINKFISLSLSSFKHFSFNFYQSKVGNELKSVTVFSVYLVCKEELNLLPKVIGHPVKVRWVLAHRDQTGWNYKKGKQHCNERMRGDKIPTERGNRWKYPFCQTE